MCEGGEEARLHRLGGSAKCKRGHKTTCVVDSRLQGRHAPRAHTVLYWTLGPDLS